MRCSLLLLTLFLASQPLHCTSNFFQKLGRSLTGKRSKDDGLLDDVPTATLPNGVKIPLVGLGVGNMVAEVIPAIISHGLRSDKKVRLIDTSSVSHNEHLVAKGIVEGTEYLERSGEGKVEVHLVTKVWYTHLGYERTLMAVKETIEALKPALEHPNVSLKVHVMIHWPRCYDAVPWMNCEQEEKNLPEEVKQAGPPPHLDKVNAWKGSWKALEALVSDEKSPVVSIGVSNFHLQELEALSEIASIQPHMVEINLWSLLYDPLLVNYCHQRKIHLIAFHLFESTLRKAEEFYFSFHHIMSVGNELTTTMQSKNLITADEEIHPSQVVLAWLVQHHVSVIPRTTDISHLKDNSAVSIGKIPSMTEKQIETVAHSVEGMLSGEDVEEDASVKVTFHAKTKDIWLYWRDEEDDIEVIVATLKKGEKFEEDSHPGHKYRIFERPLEETDEYETYQVKGRYGDHHHFDL